MDNKNNVNMRNKPIQKGHGPMRGLMPGEKAKNFKHTMKVLLQYLKPFRFHMGFVLIFAILSTLFSIISPMILGKATDIVAKGILGNVGIDFTALSSVCLFIVILYLISSGFTFLQSFIMTGVSQKITYRLRKEMSEKMDRLPLKYFDSKTHGEILSRVTNDIETINQSLSQSLTQIITSTTTLVGILSVMLYISVTMTIATLVVLPSSFLVIRMVVKKSQRYFKAQQRLLGEINSHVEEMFTAHTIVKAFNGEEKSLETFKELNEELYQSTWKSQFLSGNMQPFTNLIGNMAYVVICILGGYLAIMGRLSIGGIQAFIQYVRSFNHPITQVANVANILQSTAAAAERVFEFLDEEEERDPKGFPSIVNSDSLQCGTLFTHDTMGNTANNTLSNTTLNTVNIGAKVTFEHIRFGYSDNDILIKNFSFTALPGQKIAIVGPTGAGKTTLVKLLLRFYELNGGRIMIDDVDILEYSRKDLRDMFGMVLQDAWLFNGTIMENIRYGDPQASDDKVVEASKAAHIHHFISTQPKSYETIINQDASNISLGQKQLLTIARAFLANSPILILDEATSSVDTRTEKQIQKAMASLMENRTSFVIAHRLSTIRDADVILVINNGDIVEQGSHKELIERNGFYADLYNSQF